MGNVAGQLQELWRLETAKKRGEVWTQTRQARLRLTRQIRLRLTRQTRQTRLRLRLRLSRLGLACGWLTLRLRLSRLGLACGGLICVAWNRCWRRSVWLVVGWSRWIRVV